LSDAGVAAAAARAAAEGAFYNVRTNLAGLRDGAFKSSAAVESERLIKRVERLAGEIDRRMRRSLGR
jgi:formiminotetrahydrofolate cyclodeaminase